MKSYFRDLFKNAIEKSSVNGSDVRVVGGYDPEKNEYLITVLDPITYEPKSGVSFPEQPVFNEVGDVSGCMDPYAPNYNPLATVDDGTCEIYEVVLGCTDPENPGYNPKATEDDGSCWIGGCMNPDADNYKRSV